MNAIATLPNVATTNPDVFCTFDVLHLNADGSAAFAMRRPILEGGRSLYFLASTRTNLAVSQHPAFDLGGRTYYMSSYYDGSTMEEVTEAISAADATAFGLTDADLQAADAAA